LVGLFDLWVGVRTLALSSVGAYCIAQYIQGPFMPWIAFIFLMGHLSINQLARQFLNNPAVIDITGAQMVLVMKLTAFCWNVADGRLPENDLSDFQKERAIKQLPGPLDFAGYVMFFPSLFAGPAFDYVDYKRCSKYRLELTHRRRRQPERRERFLGVERLQRGKQRRGSSGSFYFSSFPDGTTLTYLLGTSICPMAFTAESGFYICLGSLLV
jgi:hypothetical protein